MLRRLFGVELEEVGDDFGFGRVGREAVGGNALAARCTSGTGGLYNRILTDDELHQNRKVDEIRFNNGFANYANLVVAYGANEDDIAATASLPAGEYEVTGSWTVTADEVAADDHRYVPFVQVETWNNGGWTAAGRAPGASYTATDSAKVRLTYTWRRKRGLTIIVR